MIVINAWYGSFASWQTYISRFDNLSGRLLFRVPDKSLDILKYFVPSKFALRMGTDHVLTVVAFHRCARVDRGRMAVRNGLQSYHFRWGYVIGFDAETIQARKWMSGSDNVLTPVTLPVVSVYFHASLPQVTLETLWHDYDKYRGLAGKPEEPGGRWNG